MISHQDKCIFVHIPKAAGQSVESVFVNRAGLTWQKREALLLKPNAEPELGPPRLAHLQAAEYLRLGYISEALFKQYFSFSFVRNPWARLASEYQYRKQHGDVVYQQDFKSFLFENFPTPASDNYVKAKDYYRHVLPQYQFLYDDNGKCMVNFIGKFENLQRDFDHVCQALGIANVLLPHKNRTGQSAIEYGKVKYFLVQLYQRIKHSVKERPVKRPYSDFYDNESKEFVADYYRKDIELFNYHFDANNEINKASVEILQ